MKNSNIMVNVYEIYAVSKDAKIHRLHVGTIKDVKRYMEGFLELVAQDEITTVDKLIYDNHWLEFIFGDSAKFEDRYYNTALDIRLIGDIHLARLTTLNLEIEQILVSLKV